MKILTRLIIFCEGYLEAETIQTIQKLANALNLPVLRLTNPKSYFKKGKGLLTEFSYVFNHVLYQLRHTNYIVEGGLLSSLIDRDIYNRKSKLNYIYPLITKVNPLVIFFTTSKKSMFFEKDRRNQNVSSVNKIKILNGYEKYFEKQQMVSVLKVDIANKTSKQTVEEILMYLEKEKFIKI